LKKKGQAKTSLGGKTIGGGEERSQSRNGDTADEKKRGRKLAKGGKKPQWGLISTRAPKKQEQKFKKERGEREEQVHTQ